MCSWRPSPRSSWLLLCHLSLAGEVTAKRKGALDAPTAQSGWRASRNSFPSPYSPSPACSLWTIYFSKLRERKLLSAWTDSSLSIAHSPVFTLPFFLILSQDICVLSMRLLQPQLPSVPLFIKRQKKKKKDCFPQLSADIDSAHKQSRNLYNNSKLQGSTSCSPEARMGKVRCYPLFTWEGRQYFILW